ncbi:DUF3168 domain-containing protein [Sutcliffiella halmapala]|uniref:DUF3168 domain-containing protein n=1 Tax=Sutcliffiella halmapala TaxID=79882 RepID=UPI0014746846|nr:DUF3168 domain-containing protein [Sutcliffiella halmapala]
MTALYKAQEAIFQRLEENEDLQKRVTGIFDYVPESTGFPFIVLGRIYSMANKTKTTEGEKLEITLDIWSTYQGKEETIDIMNLVEASLTEELSVEGAFLISQEVKDREVLEQENGLFHGTLMYEILVDLEGL